MSKLDPDPYSDLATFAGLSRLHNSESGVREKNLRGGHEAYASELARYIRCPSTVRVRTLERFGYAPHIDAIRQMQAEHRADRDDFRLLSERLGEDEDDAREFTFAGVGFFARYGPELVEPETAEPQAAFDDLPEALPAALPREVIAEVAKAYRVSPDDITGPSRLLKFVRPRNMAAFILRQRGRTAEVVGQSLGGRDQSTITHACRRFDALANEAERKFAARLIGGAA